MDGVGYSRWIKRGRRMVVEHIGKTLGSLKTGVTTADRKTTEPKPELEPDVTDAEKLERLRRSLGVASLENTFENFKPVSGTGKALAAFKAIASGKTNWKMLLCYGGVGNGKTHLCEAAATALYKRGVFCRVLTMARIMGALRGCIGPGANASLDELLNNYCYCERLILDDVGMGGSGSAWEFGQLEEIIVARYRERLFTILTTNRDLDELPPRIVSRFRDPDVGRVVVNDGQDYRGLKGGK